MRVAEKTVELNFCSQLSSTFGGRLLWFGLTQAQEAQAGFDACTQLGRSMLIVQFKASNQLVRGYRRFRAKDAQMRALSARARVGRRIFYALPDLGTTHELTANPDLLSQTWLLDVTDLPDPIPLPTTASGPPRRSAVHHVDMRPPMAVVHSEPVEIKLWPVSAVLNEMRAGPRETELMAPMSQREFYSLRGVLSRGAVGVVVL